MVIAARPLVDPVAAEYAELKNLDTTQTIELGSMPQEDITRLICQRLEVNSLPDSLASLIYTKGQGNPFFSEELAFALREAGLIVVEDGRCQISAQAGDLQTVDLPDTIQGIITTRIDRLTPSQQLTLKVASVIGRSFAYGTLHDVHPIEADKVHLTDYLNTLDKLNITQLETPEPTKAYSFRQTITQEVAYNMMLFAQRRELHRAIAEWIEANYVDELSPFYPVLAYHWRKAQLNAKAINYLEKAGEQALENYANEEAIEFFSRAVALAELPDDSVDKVDATDNGHNAAAPIQIRRGFWELKQGEAYSNWVKYGEARAHLEQGLALLAFPVPKSTVGLATGLGGEIARQFARRLTPKFIRRHSPDNPMLLEAARAYENLTAVYYFAHETLLSLYAAFRSLNLAEIAGPSPELARGYASVGVIIGFIPIHRLARAYCRRALRMAKQLDNLPALAWVSLLSGTYYTGVGNWKQARQLLQQTIDIAERLGDSSRYNDGISNLAAVHYLMGEFENGQRLYDILAFSSENHNDAHNLAWALRGQVFCQIVSGDFDGALDRLGNLESLLRDTHVVDEALHIDLHGLRAIIYLRQNLSHLALESAEKATKLLSGTSPTSYSSLPGYAGVAETYLTLWEQEIISALEISPNLLDPTRIQQRKWKTKEPARRACKALIKYARVFPIGQPRAYLWQGVFEWMAGRPRLAQELWQKSLSSSKKLDMPYAQGLACYEIGRRLPVGDPARGEYLAQAEEIFTKLEATYDMKRLRELKVE